MPSPRAPSNAAEPASHREESTSASHLSASGVPLPPLAARDTPRSLRPSRARSTAVLAPHHVGLPPCSPCSPWCCDVEGRHGVGEGSAPPDGGRACPLPNGSFSERYSRVMCAFTAGRRGSRSADGASAERAYATQQPRPRRGVNGASAGCQAGGIVAVCGQLSRATHDGTILSYTTKVMPTCSQGAVTSTAAWSCTASPRALRGPSSTSVDCARRRLASLSVRGHRAGVRSTECPIVADETGGSPPSRHAA